MNLNKAMVFAAVLGLLLSVNPQLQAGHSEFVSHSRSSIIHLGDATLSLWGLSKAKPEIPGVFGIWNYFAGLYEKLQKQKEEQTKRDDMLKKPEWLVRQDKFEQEQKKMTEDNLISVKFESGDDDDDDGDPSQTELCGFPDKALAPGHISPKRYNGTLPAELGKSIVVCGGGDGDGDNSAPKRFKGNEDGDEEEEEEEDDDDDDDEKQQAHNCGYQNCGYTPNGKRCTAELLLKSVPCYPSAVPCSSSSMSLASSSYQVSSANPPPSSSADGHDCCIACGANFQAYAPGTATSSHVSNSKPHCALLKAVAGKLKKLYSNRTDKEKLSMFVKCSDFDKRIYCDIIFSDAECKEMVLHHAIKHFCNDKDKVKFESVSDTNNFIDKNDLDPKLKIKK